MSSELNTTNNNNIINTTTTTNTKGRQLGIKSGKPICCCCPDTKLLRDECIVMNGEEKCFDYIEKHKECLRAEGFNI